MRILTLAQHTIKENIRHRSFYVVLIFALVVVMSSFIFSMLNPLDEIRIIRDVGLGAVELFILVSALFTTVGLILPEIENRTIYLVLSRPLKRGEFIVGRYLGMLGSIGLNLLIMCSGLFLLLLVKGWHWEVKLGVDIFFIFLKIVLITSIGIFFTLVSTSAVSSLTATFFIWVVGHLTEELKYINYLLKEKGVVITPLLKFLYTVLPNFQYFNFKDFPKLSGFFPELGIAGTVLYCLVYSGLITVFSVMIFSKKEF